jgi:BirA family transcriptional regulator, biotin operon repressor / biotin---[acetyl-CoA-carboxylase] ligase
VTDPLTHWEGEPVRVWEGLWGVPLLEAWAVLDSTNDRARQLADTGAAPFSLVIAEEQTAGRGRGGRPWWSPAESGLWLSLVAPHRPDVAMPRVSLLVGVAIARAIESVTPVTVELKWPNDIWVNRRKVAGILCEAAGGSLVVGVGVNVRQRREDFAPELRERASSLEAETGGAVSRGALAGALMRELRRTLDRPAARLEGELARELSERDALRGRALSVDGVSGVGAGLEADGRLRIEVAPGRVHAVVTGHVEMDDPGGTPAGPSD